MCLDAKKKGGEVLLGDCDVMCRKWEIQKRNIDLHFSL